MTEEDLRKRAKEAGIKSWHVKNVERLKKELSESGVTNEQPAPEPVSAFEPESESEPEPEAEAEAKPEAPKTTRVLMHRPSDGHYMWVFTYDMQRYHGFGYRAVIQ